MNINEQFPSKYLKAIDLKGKKIGVTIDQVTVEEVGDGQKPILYFADKAKGLVLNKTNSMIIAASYGPETNGWTGKALHLYSTKVNYQNQMVDGIRVEVPVAMTAEEPDF